MNPSAAILLPGLLFLVGAAASCEDHPQISKTNAPGGVTKENKSMKENRVRIIVGDKTFTATLADNPTASTFKAMLPLSLKMSDLHGNEKLFHFPSSLPSNDENPGTIQTGDLMLWTSDTLVLFYQSFPTSYRYTRIGRIDNPEGLSAAVGAKDVSINFDAE